MDGYVIKLDELIDDYEELLNGMADSLRELLEVEKESRGTIAKGSSANGLIWDYTRYYPFL